MLDQILFFLKAMLDQTGAAHFWWGNLVMIVIGATMVYLAIAKPASASPASSPMCRALT